MRKAKKPDPKSDEPRQFGEMLIYKAVVAPRKRRRKPSPANQPLLWDGIGGAGTAAAAPDRTAAGRSEDRTAAAAEGGGGLLFQSNGHCCNTADDAFSTEDSRVFRPEDLGSPVGDEYRIRPCRCRKWFCKPCGPRMGRVLRDRLGERLKAFTGVFGVTLTVDGSLFACPEDSWQYVMDERLLWRLVRDLHLRG